MKSNFILILSLGAATLVLTGYGMLVAYIVRFRREVQNRELCEQKHIALEKLNRERYDNLIWKIELLTKIVLNSGKKPN